MSGTGAAFTFEPVDRGRVFRPAAGRQALRVVTWMVLTLGLVGVATWFATSPGPTAAKVLGPVFFVPFAAWFGRHLLRCVRSSLHVHRGTVTARTAFRRTTVDLASVDRVVRIKAVPSGGAEFQDRLYVLDTAGRRVAVLGDDLFRSEDYDRVADVLGVPAERRFEMVWRDFRRDHPAALPWHTTHPLLLSLAILGANAAFLAVAIPVATMTH